MTEGERYWITGAAGRDLCEVVQVMRPDEFPSLELGELGVVDIRPILGELDVDLLVLFRGRLADPESVCFFVLRDSAGVWRDVRGNELQIVRDFVGQQTGLDLRHWPQPGECPACGHNSLFFDGPRARCTSLECDPGAATFAELDAEFRRLQSLRLRRS